MKLLILFEKLPEGVHFFSGNVLEGDFNFMFNQCGVLCFAGRTVSPRRIDCLGGFLLGGIEFDEFLDEGVILI